MFVDDDSIINYRENGRERNNEVESKLIDDSERGIENVDYINVRRSHNSITSIKNDRNCKDDDNKNFGGDDYRDERGSVKCKTIKNVDSIRKSKDNEYREIDI